MTFIKYLPITILFFFLLKFLISYIERLTISLNEKYIEKQIETGMLSIKDIQKNNYKNFINIINIYFNILGIEERNLLSDTDNDLINFKCLSNNEYIFVSCIQNDLNSENPKDEDNLKPIGRPEVQSFLSRTFINDCHKGILITNSTFSNIAIDFINDFNDKNHDIEIKLIDGYQLTKAIRNNKYYIMKEGLNS